MYVGFSINERKKLKSDNYRAEVYMMQKKLSTLIDSKQSATLAIALSIANDERLLEHISQKNIPKNYYRELISRLNKNTHYKNIWVHVLDNDLNTLYKSWSSIKEDNTKDFREDLSKALKTKEPVLSISSDSFDLSIRAIVPLIKNNRNIGVIEVISHFNSISKEMKNFNIDSIVALKKEPTKKIKHPFSDIFIEGHYIANLDAAAFFIEYLKKEGIENFFNSSYKIKDNYIIVSKEIKGLDSKTVAYYIMFKNMKNISNKNLDFFMFKWFTLSALGILILAAIIGNIIYFRSKKQKKYYKNIIDSSSNIVVVVDKNSIIDVNRTFFKYFYTYKNLADFKTTHNSISDFFIEEDGYVSKSMNGVNWLEYLIENPHKNQVKIIYDKKEYYFSVGVSLISSEDEHYSAIFSDITKEKIYQKKLEYTNITDSLTKIRNRYYYNEQIKKESANASRYSYPLSLIIFDVDYFKKINDRYGHDVGDNVLVEYTKLINTMLRKGDIFCRIGGEEFALILPHTNRQNAYKIAEKLRVKIEEYKKIIPVTMSFGVVEYNDGEEIEATFKRADEALYEAKDMGRNKVVIK